MDISSLTGENGGTPEQEKDNVVEYTAQAASSLVSGEVKMTIGDNALTVAALFDTVEITFAEMNELKMADYTVIVRADSGDYTFSRMGSWCEPFYGTLCDEYNKAVLRSLFIKSKSVVTAKGDYRYTEKNTESSGAAPVRVYDNNVTVLPPDLSARRVPLCFTTGLDKGDFSTTLMLDTGESYTFAKLGYDTAPFTDAVEKQIRKLREESLTAVKDIDPSLPTAPASQLAKLMPRGAAAPIGQIAGIAPSFVTALEGKIAATRAAESYTVFKELCDPTQIWVGFRKNETAKDAGGTMPGGAMADGAASDDLSDGNGSVDAINGSDDNGGQNEAAPDPFLLWLIAPSPDGLFAAVEFAEANSATFVYRTGGDFTAFARQINRALEAIDFKREVIRLSDEELRKPENADYYMADKRTAALQYVRGAFTGRVIHASLESWKRKLTELWSPGKTVAGSTPTSSTIESPDPARTGSKFCGQCGAALAPGMKFCGSCGAKV